jgi:hypothetical protein
VFNNFLIQIKTNWVAIYGAIVGTISIIFVILHYFRDRSKITIKTDICFIIDGEPYGYKDKTEYISIEIINSGRRPVKIKSVGGKIIGQKNQIIFTDSLVGKQNKLIDENNPSVNFLTEKKELAVNNFYYFEAIDQTGKRYKKWINCYKYIIDKIFRKI